MADGTAVSLAGYAMAQPYNGTTSATANKVDVVGPFPAGTRYLTFYFANAARMGHPGSGTKTTAATLTSSDTGKTIPATTWMVETYSGGKVYFSSATVSTDYELVPHATHP